MRVQPATVVAHDTRCARSLPPTIRRGTRRGRTDGRQSARANSPGQLPPLYTLALPREKWARLGVAALQRAVQSTTPRRRVCGPRVCAQSEPRLCDGWACAESKSYLPSAATYPCAPACGRARGLVAALIRCERRARLPSACRGGVECVPGRHHSRTVGAVPARLGEPCATLWTRRSHAAARHPRRRRGAAARRSAPGRAPRRPAPRADACR